MLVAARNEQEVLERTLASLRNQTIRVFLVVVDDGSTDGTRRVASQYADRVVSLPPHVENLTGKPKLARIFNSGLSVLRNEEVDYVLISGADSVYPKDYLERIIEEMERGHIVLASGVAEGEASHSLSPRGSGRVVQAAWFRTIGFNYPENYGFEVYIVYKALSQGKKVVVLPALQFHLSRGTRLSERKMYLWGKSMKVLYYWWVYALGRCILTGLTNPSNGIAMIRGYLSDAPERYDDLKQFVPNFQKKLIMKRAMEIL